jgi:hypothetical protein
MGEGEGLARPLNGEKLSGNPDKQERLMVSAALIGCWSSACYNAGRRMAQNPGQYRYDWPYWGMVIGSGVVAALVEWFQ